MTNRMELSNAYHTYKTNSVTTASPGELTLMLYNGCLKFMNIAKTAIKENNIEEKNINIIKAQGIIHELMITLNMDLEVSKNMMSLYDYMHRQLVQANIKNNIALIEEVEELVTEFCDTWKQVIQLNRQQQYGSQGGHA